MFTRGLVAYYMDEEGRYTAYSQSRIWLPVISYQYVKMRNEIKCNETEEGRKVKSVGEMIGKWKKKSLKNPGNFRTEI